MGEGRGVAQVGDVEGIDPFGEPDDCELLRLLDEADLEEMTWDAREVRTQRFTEAHEWVLEHHAATFEKLGKGKP